MADVLNVREQLRITLTRNGANLYTQNFSPAAESYTVHASDRLVLAAGMVAFQQANLGDIDGTPGGQHLMVLSDRAITIAVNDTAKEVVASTLIMVGSTISSLFFKNTDANNTATVEFVVTD